MKICVLSDGGWGTAIAKILSENNHLVTLWGPFEDNIIKIRETGFNQRFLPDIALPKNLFVTASLKEAINGAEFVVLAAPSQFMRPLLNSLANTLEENENPILINVAKGIEVGSNKRISEMVAELLGKRKYAVLSGPSHAEEVARGIPTAVVVASEIAEVAEKVQHIFMNNFFRVYTHFDVVGVELGGALKNVLALACGVCDGMGFGDNTKAALMTRGIAEMSRLGEALGGHPLTFTGLSGVGDLIVTCTSKHSRNRYVGEELGKGRKLDDIQKEMGMVIAEGVKTAQSAYELAKNNKIETPIINEIYLSLYEGKNPHEAVISLMERNPKSEMNK